MKDIKKLLESLSEKDFGNDVDLHIHSNCSDGQMTPYEVIEFAKKKGLKYISIADHNTLNAYLETNILKENFVIPAIEFDCWYRGILIHILGYGVDVTNKELQAICAKDKAQTEKDIVRFFTFRHPKTAINAIKKAGGVPVLAHPACYWAISLDHFVKCLMKLGIEGLEVFYPYKRHRGIIKFHLLRNVKKIADKYNLIQTGGTDTHGKFL